jgi:beta-mannosidase
MTPPPLDTTLPPAKPHAPGRDPATLDVVWEIGHVAASQREPHAWAPARIPGAAQLDIAAARKLPDYRIGTNVEKWAALEECGFVYRTKFSRPRLAPGEQLFFHADGLDYEACIVLNGATLLRHVGPYSPVDVELTPHLAAENELRIEIAPVPKRRGAPTGRAEADEIVKAAVSYGWDFHPRLVPTGLWADTRIEHRAASRIDRAEFSFELAEDLASARIRCTLEGRQLAGRRVRLRLLDSEGNAVVSHETELSADAATIELGAINRVRLWWPRHHGTPHLYRWEVSLLDERGGATSAQTGRLGFRRVRLLMNEGAWAEPVLFPKSRSVAPIQFEVNGRKLFLKGANWVPPEIFPGTATPARYAGLIDRAASAHLDILRVWGGGGPAHESFYKHCDEQGMLVWQDFPLACNVYPDDDAYLAVLDAEARAIVRRLRAHASVVVWCGGNELFNAWSRMTDQSLALRTLNALCLALDPTTPFLATAPLEGMGHGHYLFIDFERGEEVFQLMARARQTAYGEFGISAPAPVDALREIIPVAELWPPRHGGAWATHHAFGAWTEDTWLGLRTLAHYFGPSAGLEEMVERGQLLQAEGLKCVFEEARRQKPYCSLAMVWCLNEPWPCAANTSLIAYPDRPKPALAAVAQACRPVLASARIGKFSWSAGETFSAELWLLNDRSAGEGAAIPPGVLRAFLDTGGRSVELLAWSFPAVAANTNLAGPTARVVLPAAEGRRFHLRVEVDGQPSWSSDYTLLYCRATEPADAPGAAPRLNQ